MYQPVGYNTPTLGAVTGNSGISPRFHQYNQQYSNNNIISPRFSQNSETTFPTLQTVVTSKSETFDLSPRNPLLPSNPLEAAATFLSSQNMELNLLVHAASSLGLSLSKNFTDPKNKSNPQTSDAYNPLEDMTNDEKRTLISNLKDKFNLTLAGLQN